MEESNNSRTDEQPTVFSEMFSLLRPLNLEAVPRTCLDLPNIFSTRIEKQEEEEVSVERLVSTTRVISACPHTERKHYAKNMCNQCYHKLGRNKHAWRCPHPERPLYAKGSCQGCYLKQYRRQRRRRFF